MTNNKDAEHHYTIAEIEAMLAKITQGKWNRRASLCIEGKLHCFISTPKGTICRVDGHPDNEVEFEANRDLIYQVPTIICQLLDRVKEVEQIKRLCRSLIAISEENPTAFRLLSEGPLKELQVLVNPDYDIEKGMKKTSEECDRVIEELHEKCKVDPSELDEPCDI